jgi:hypothetical protein
MGKKIFFISLVILFAFAILLVSILRSASVRHSFNQNTPITTDENTNKLNSDLDQMQINYYLAYPGGVLPGDLLWPIKAFRDRLWLLLTTDASKKSELNLLFADKRIQSARVLFEKGEYDLGFSTLSKAEKYLEKAALIQEQESQKGADASELAMTLANASLRHRQLLKHFITVVPDELKSQIILLENNTKDVYIKMSEYLLAKDINPPKNPFDGE